jgi:hypothetical protein
MTAVLPLVLDLWRQGKFFEAGLQTLEEVAPIPFFAAMVAIPLYTSLYLWSKTHTVPVVAMMLMGGTVIAMLPGPVANVAWVLILLAGGTAIFAIIWLVIR